MKINISFVLCILGQAVSQVFTSGPDKRVHDEGKRLCRGYEIQKMHTINGKLFMKTGLWYSLTNVSDNPKRDEPFFSAHMCKNYMDSCYNLFNNKTYILEHYPIGYDADDGTVYTRENCSVTIVDEATQQYTIFKLPNYFYSKICCNDHNIFIKKMINRNDYAVEIYDLNMQLVGMHNFSDFSENKKIQCIECYSENGQPFLVVSFNDCIRCYSIIDNSLYFTNYMDFELFEDEKVTKMSTNEEHTHLLVSLFSSVRYGGSSRIILFCDDASGHVVYDGEGYVIGYCPSLSPS